MPGTAWSNGCAVNALGIRQLASLHAAVLKTLWGERRAARCKEIVFMLFAKGHRLDPVQACVYNRLVLFRRLMRRRQDLHAMHQCVWRLRDARRCCVPGPIAKLFVAVEALGWSWVDPFVLRLPDGRELHVLQSRARSGSMIFERPCVAHNGSARLHAARIWRVYRSV